VGGCALLASESDWRRMLLLKSCFGAEMHGLTFIEPPGIPGAQDLKKKRQKKKKQEFPQRQGLYTGEHYRFFLQGQGLWDF
jgi:hypothetical protein